MKKKDLEKELKALGFRKERDRGNHEVWKNTSGKSIPIPRHREINELTAKSILKIIKGSQ